MFVSKKPLPALPPGAVDGVNSRTEESEGQQDSGNSADGGKQEELADSFTETWLRIDASETVATPGFPVKEIEEDIVAELVKRHGDWIGDSQSTTSQ